MDHIQNLMILTASIIIGFLSFLHYEKPLLLMSRATKSSKTISAGLCAMAWTVVFVWSSTSDLAPGIHVENDRAEIFITAIDTRKTSLYACLPNRVHMKTLYYNILDRSTIPSERESFQDGKIVNFTEPSIVIMCKSLWESSPCTSTWPHGTEWIWLSSNQLCGAENHSDSIEYEKRCNDILPITDLHLSHEQNINLALHVLVLEANNVFPESLNAHTINRLHIQYTKVAHFDNKGSNREHSPMQELTMTMIGESIGARIGMFFLN